jgi:hypothetical protein
MSRRLESEQPRTSEAVSHSAARRLRRCVQDAGTFTIALRSIDTERERVSLKVAKGHAWSTLSTRPSFYNINYCNPRIYTAATR